MGIILYMNLFSSSVHSFTLFSYVTVLSGFNELPSLLHERGNVIERTIFATLSEKPASFLKSIIFIIEPFRSSSADFMSMSNGHALFILFPFESIMSTFD